MLLEDNFIKASPVSLQAAGERTVKTELQVSVSAKKTLTPLSEDCLPKLFN